MKAKLIKQLLVVLILVAGFFVMKGLVATGPVAKKKTPPPMKAIVETLVLKPGADRITIEGMGSVIAAREVHIHSQVSGKVIDVAPGLLEGQFIEKGTVLVRIEADDYALAVNQAESDLANKSAQLAIEMGFQKVALREWELLGESGGKIGDSSLALREPQLAQAKAAKAGSEAALELAHLNLSRTELSAPFNAIVTSKNVELGSMAMMNGAVASLVATDAFHVRVSVPESQLAYLQIPGAEAQVRLSSTDVTLPGRAISLLGDLDPDGRMARVLVEVEDPLGLETDNAKRPKLLLGAYVTVDLTGEPLPGIITIPRDAIHEGGTVWLMRDNKTLEIREVDVLWKNRTSAMVRGGLAPGEKLITSPLSFASEGMPVADVDAPSVQRRPGKGRPGNGKPGASSGGKPGKGPGGNKPKPAESSE